MTPLHSTCPEQCDAYTPGDNYCRSCGMFVAQTNLPVPAGNALPATEEQTVLMVERQTTRALDRPRAQLPAPVVKAAAAVAVGTALQVGLALAARYMASSARPAPRPARRRVRIPVPQAPAAPTPSNPPALLDDGIVAVTESVTFLRTWIRRG